MWKKNPVLFLVLALAAIMVGPIVTMVAPFATVNTEADRMACVKPYTALELAGHDIGWCEAAAEAAEEPKAGTNPFKPDPATMKAGKALYREHCSGCHGSDLSGSIGPDIRDIGIEDADLFTLIYGGIADSGMPGFSRLGSKRIWKVVTFVNNR